LRAQHLHAGTIPTERAALDLWALPLPESTTMAQIRAYGFRLAVLSSFVLVLAAPFRWH
jgi:hypothetical protein